MDNTMYALSVTSKRMFGKWKSGDWWLSPEGDVYRTSFTQHAKCAASIISQKGWHEHWQASRFKHSSMDYLHVVRGYMRMESHCQTLIYCSRSDMPQAQVDALEKLTGTNWYTSMRWR